MTKKRVRAALSLCDPLSPCIPKPPSASHLAQRMALGSHTCPGTCSLGPPTYPGRALPHRPGGARRPPRAPWLRAGAAKALDGAEGTRL